MVLAVQGPEAAGRCGAEETAQLHGQREDTRRTNKQSKRQYQMWTLFQRHAKTRRVPLYLGGGGNLRKAKLT